MFNDTLDVVLTFMKRNITFRHAMSLRALGKALCDYEETDVMSNL